jgi:ABC-type Fe3+-hydroxamate transport system substrate-binding protein
MKKMKTKTLVLVGIAVCTILLASSVLASAGYSKIYGNANEDDILVSMLDVGQTKLIILGKEKELTLVDQADRTVTIPRPVERVVSTSLGTTRVVVALDGCDRLKGSEVGTGGRDWTTMPCVGELQFACGGKITEVEDVGWGGKNVEMIASLRPDVTFGGSSNADALQDQTGAAVVVAAPSWQSPLSELEKWNIEIKIVGVVLEREEEAEDLISFMEEKTSLVTDILSKIPDSEKPRVYFASRAGSHGYEITRTTGYYRAIDYAGGLNVAKEDAATTSEFEVSKEQIIVWNPDIILLKCHKSNPPSESQYTIEMALSDPEFIAGNVNAVKNGNVYYCMATCRGYPIQRYIPEVMYFAKMFHPEEFNDLDLEKEGNEIMEKFFCEEGLYTWLADDHGYIREFIENPPEEKEW